MKNNSFICRSVIAFILIGCISLFRGISDLPDTEKQIKDNIQLENSLSTASKDKLMAGEQVVISFYTRVAKTFQAKITKLQVRASSFQNFSTRENSFVKKCTRNYPHSNLLLSQNHIKIQRFNI